MSAMRDRTFAEVAPRMREWERRNLPSSREQREDAVIDIAAEAFIFNSGIIDLDRFMARTREILTVYGVAMFLRGYMRADGESVE